MTSVPAGAISKRDNVVVFDTTMRDGEQSPGASMSLEEKLELAKILEEMGVDVIEAGFPIASNGDFEAVRQIAELITESTVCGLARAAAGDIDRCAEAVRRAKRGRIHTFISTSPVHMKYKLQMEPDAVLEAITRSVSHARNLVGDVEWSAEDATRTERDFLKRCVEAAIKAGATTINLPDTVGYSYPSEYGELFRDVITSVPGADKAIFSAHCHNDLGLAVANSIAAIEGGARQVEVAINGIGERAGNAALEEIVMALRVRGDHLPYGTSVDPVHITRASRYVSAITGFPVQFNKAIVGKNAFAHESGIHQDGMLKNAETYEIMKPEDVGQGATNLVMGKHSGRHAFREKLKALGYELGQNALNDAFGRFKELADKKKHVFDDDIVALVDDALARGSEKIRVSRLRVVAGTDGQSAELTLDIDGVASTAEATGDGPVDAVFNAIHKIVPHSAALRLFQVHAVTEGTDAQAQVSVRLEEDGRIATGAAADTDTLTASAKAYVNALNNLFARKEKSRPEAAIASGF
ncbi:2-isopropylmalate synthase [Caulobacter vibrioides]|uniref:2-isopropylmalate synthase n=2 Tax=Caulobacter vibrioides TaxID=155892 RepID=LEU1_CAUVC|nr:2-isopropylmalate synthase [Caulobacter vibrioides]YP_002516983.1 2-isopropylmalate synthase [Caulobacter vibrioides NA1000]B8H607.1 RecName: Full=2-isopropylmalate synthase; AltName: Full=Alpha-IPM synthase; AltName: Full=Alpha-isopropylmalate synthase [Caulobacter vibrioides NA1000]Q9A823.1 RecName: Full=2-isopropylmalate synthase; AltName: Full=Alpha-IPM synthase; AltName: Full=Alpha-isopropylmalate synthase [Caulobacter vibrioides CB15]AAK23520.1 2-isopropylmalate synthase [Caulobacter v